jgi:hypothetical protein
MNNEPMFSPEYDIKNATDSQSSIQKKVSSLQGKEADEFISKIEADYELSKPRRKVIRARIIQR